VKYRDFRYVIPFIVQFGLYISPVAFSSSSVLNNVRIPLAIKYVYSLNPLVGIIDGFRWCIISGAEPLDTKVVMLSAGISIGLLFFGLWYFRKTEKYFADII
jgi:lipopolysaccharide transport system permease protein